MHRHPHICHAGKFCLLALLTMLPVEASLSATLTVCPSGCDHSTIQAAVNVASAGDTVQLQMLTPHTETDVIISKDLTIEGLSKNETIVQGADVPGVAPSRVFTLLGGNTAVMRNFTIRHGYESATNGGGVWVQAGANLTLEQLVVGVNRSELDGGGIQNEGTLALNEVSIFNNVAQVGAGIYNDGELVLENTGFDFNAALGNGINTGLGGGLFNQGSLTMHSATVRSNEAQTGGGIYNIGGLALNNTTIFDNLASRYRGGGIFSHNETGQPFSITDSTISSNLAATDGGGVWVVASSATMNRVVFDSNLANIADVGTGGGGIGNRGQLSLVDITLVNNEAIDGAGILNEGELAIINSVIESNQAEENGGAVSNNYAFRPSLTVSNTQLRGNSAGSNGGGIFSTGDLAIGQGSALVENVADQKGGGIYNGATLPVTITDTLLQSNRVDNTSGENDHEGGGIFTVSPINISRSRFEFNVAHVSDDATAGRGAGLFADGTEVSVTQSVFWANVTNLGAGIYGENAQITMVDSALLGNDAFQLGGGFYSAGSALELSNVTIGDNFAWFFGGGLYIESGDVSLANVTITQNRAGNSNANFATDGGGLYLCPSCTATLRMRSSIIADNVVGPFGDYPDCRGTFTGGSFSLIGDTGPSFVFDEQCEVGGITTGMIYNTSAQLDDLSGYNPALLGYDFMAVYPLLLRSPAIDAGSCVDATGVKLTTDQRGAPMPVDGGSGEARCDMGAYEFLSMPPVVDDLFADGFESP